MNPTPTPDSPSPQPVDIARLRELLAKATPGIVETGDDGTNDLLLVIEEETQDEIVLFVSDEATRDDRHLFIALRNAAPALLDELERLRAEPKGEDLIFIRCINHMHVPQQNDATVDGAECGACIAAERDKLREEVERLREQNTNLISELENYRPIAEVRGATIAISERDKAISECDSLRRENAELRAKMK